MAYLAVPFEKFWKLLTEKYAKFLFKVTFSGETSKLGHLKFNLESVGPFRV